MSGPQGPLSPPTDVLPLPLRFWQWPGIAVLLALALAAFAPVLGGQRFPYGSDTVAHDYVMHLWGWQKVIVDRGEWPLWCPLLFSGLPFLGSYALCPFYPTGWLQTLLPMPVAFSLQYVLALVVGGAGMVRLARQLGCGRRVALGAGIAMMASGHFLTLIHAGHLQKMIAAGWAPWVLASSLALAGMGVRRPSPDPSRLQALLGWPTQWLILAVALTMQMLAAHPQIFYGSVVMAGIVLIPWGLLRPSFLLRHTWPVTLQCALGIFRLMLAAGFALALSGPQTFSGVETGSVSNRSAGVSYDEATATSYPPLELLEYVIPSVFGDSIRGARIPYFGSWGERIVSDFLGLGVLSLALLGWWALRRSSPANWRRAGRTAWILSALLLTSLIVALGRHTPVYMVLWAILPGFSSFRSPGTFMFVANLVLLALAAVGTQSLLHHWTQRPVRRSSLENSVPLPHRQMPGWLLPGLVALGAVLGLYGLYENLGVRLDLATGAEARRWRNFASLSLFGFQLAGITTLIFLTKKAPTQPLRTTFVTILGVMTVALMAWSNTRYVRFEPLAPFQAYLNQETWRAASRPGTPHAPMPGEWPRILEENDLLVAALAHESGTPTGYHPVVLARYEALRTFVPHQSPVFAAMMAINFARTRNETPPPDTIGSFQRAARQASPAMAYLWRRTEPFPPVREGVQVRAVSDLQEAASLLADGYNNGTAASTAIVVDDDLEQVPTMQEGTQISTGARLEWQSPNRGQITLSARPIAAVVLPLAIPYAPGWKASDQSGRPIPLIPVDLGATAVVMPTGTTGVQLAYHPFSFRFGLFVMLIALGIIALVTARRIPA